MSGFGDFLANAGTTVADTVLERVPLLQIPAAIAGYETEAAQERREARNFRKLEREFALKKMAHYDEDRKANLVRQQKQDEYWDKMRPLNQRTAENQAAISDINLANAEQLHVNRIAQNEWDELFRKGSVLTQNAINGFGGRMNKAQQIELYDSPIGQEFRDYMVFAENINSDNPRFRRIALKTANKLGLQLSADGKNVILKDGKTVPLDDNLKKYFREGYEKQLVNNASAIVRRDESKNYIDGYTRWDYIGKLAEAMNHPRNNNKGNLSYAENTFDSLMKGFTQTERAQFMIYGAIKNFLSDGVFSPEEQAKYGDQLAYWADNFGIKYNVKEDGTVNIIDKNGKEHNGKEYFEKAFNEHAITKSFNQTIERIKKQNSNADEQAKSNAEMQQWYADADAVNGLRLANIDDKEKQKVRTAWAESIMMFNKLKELHPDNIDENILKSRQYFRNIAGDKFASPFDRDADEIELERSQNNLSSLEGKVTNQRNKVSQVKTTDNDTPLYDTLGLVPNTLPADYSRAITSSNNAEKRKLDSMVEEFNKAKDKHNKYQASYDKNVKRFGNYKTYRKRNKKDK